MKTETRWGGATLVPLTACVFVLYFVSIFKPDFLHLIRHLPYLQLEQRNYSDAISISAASTPQIGRLSNKTNDKQMQEENETACHGEPRVVCNCSTQPRVKRNSKQELKQSRCSAEASLLGPGQNVISYSLFRRDFMGFRGAKAYRIQGEKTKGYLGGFRCNLEAMRKYYPGWVMRIYTNLESRELCDYACEKDFFICDVRNLPVHGDVTKMNPIAWRFLPLGDPTVSKFIVRDADSRITRREHAAVKQWLSSRMPFHAMRDHPAHIFTIMGGMWGGNNDLIGLEKAMNLARSLIKAGSSKRFSNYDGDQWLLRSVIYKPHKEKILIHASYHCKRFKENHTVPFPVRRLEPYDAAYKTAEMGTDIVGITAPCPRPVMADELLKRIIRTESYKGLPDCPVECRPKYGMHWRTC